jgi:16S rRNA (uracil1498-N3)-methyltransferase
MLTGMSGGEFWLTGDELRHLAVVRLGPGDTVIGFDGEGSYRGVITEVGAERAVCRIEAALPGTGEAAARIYLVMGLAKGEKIEWVIQKGTELGMSGFIPLVTARSIVRPDESRRAAREARRRKIAAEAAKQCGRIRPPAIWPVAAWAELPALLPPDTAYILAWEEEKERSFRAELAQTDWGRPLALLIGPEGGFTPAEAGFAARELKAAPVSLGERVLRSETAALAVLALALGAAGDLG